MSSKFSTVDDITMELATVIDEFSAVDCYRMKKNLPLQLPNKKTLSYQTILNSDYPGYPSHTGSKHKLPASIDMDYLDMLSGKNTYLRNEEATKIRITMEAFEKLCYQPELPKSQKQALIENVKAEENTAICDIEKDLDSQLQSEEPDDIDEDQSPCSPCCFDFLSSEPTGDKEDLDEILQNPVDEEVKTEEEKDEGKKDKEVKDEEEEKEYIVAEPLASGQLSDIPSEETSGSNDIESSLKKESPQETEKEVSSNQNLKTETSDHKKKNNLKTKFKEFFSRSKERQ